MKTKYEPDVLGSYNEQDVVFLLRDISEINIERDTTEREHLIQSGTHYAEMLPVEFQPGEQYMELFHATLKEYAQRIAIATGVVAEQIVKNRGLDQLVLVSLARAGTPIGILIKRYIQHVYHVTVPHYSISIVRDRGIDETAIDYIFEHHAEANIQFVDGWTGKGAITRELVTACDEYSAKRPNLIDPDLAVLADPGHCVEVYGTRDDFLIPSACLNSTVSGLVSRTVLNPAFIEEGDFHGAKYYKEFAEQDVSNYYVDEVSNQFEDVKDAIHATLQDVLQSDRTPTWRGMQSVEVIKEKYDIAKINYIKPGVGETTRVLLRRVPWKILVNPKYDNDLTHIRMLAAERNVPIEVYEDMEYSCCGLIKDVMK
ncbi:MAG: cysteine protease StiP family protein [Caryophanon sp.]|nr:cysteine protease StiP family protein [Caryophanon sp.]